MLPLLLRYLYLVNHPYFRRRMVTYQIYYTTHLSNRQRRVACIDNKIYHNTFRPSSQCTVAGVYTTTVVFHSQQHCCRRYYQYAILHNMFKYFVLRMLQLCHNKIANFETTWLVTHNLNALQYVIEDQNIVHFQSNPLLMLISVVKRIQLVNLRMQSRQSLVLLQHWFHSGRHVISFYSDCRTLCGVECGKSRFSFSAISLLKWILHIQLQGSVKFFIDLTCTIQINELQNPMIMRSYNENTGIICSKLTSWLMIRINNFFQSDAFDSLAVAPSKLLLIDAIQNGSISHKSAFGNHCKQITGGNYFITLYRRQGKESSKVFLTQFITVLTDCSCISNKICSFTSLFTLLILIKKGGLMFLSESTKEHQSLMQTLSIDHCSIQIQMNKPCIRILIMTYASSMFKNDVSVTIHVSFPNIHFLLMPPHPLTTSKSVIRSILSKPAMTIQQNPYCFLRKFIQEGNFISDYLHAMWYQVTTGESASTTHLSQLVIGPIAHCQTNLLDSTNDDGVYFAEMVFGCTIRNLIESIEDEICTRVVTGCTIDDTCIHQPAHQNSTLNSILGYGGDDLIQGSHVLCFPSVNPSPHYTSIQSPPDNDMSNQDIWPLVNENEVGTTVSQFCSSVEPLLLRKSVFSFSLMGPKSPERTVFQEDEITGTPLPHLIPVQVTEVIPNNTLLVNGNNMLTVHVVDVMYAADFGRYGHHYTSITSDCETLVERFELLYLGQEGGEV